ncbi:MAG: ATP-binding protein [Imperialibacter sp.]|uniref:tetratricopeptide repeat-containing sensor histidine kinase n=1 Tax=Imperialibacter sp. TaxID=2038411 RepID=UPI003A89C95A
MRFLFSIIFTVFHLSYLLAEGSQDVVPLNDAEYPSTFYRDYFHELRKKANRDSVIVWLKDEIGKQEQLGHTVNIVNLQIILGQLSRSVSRTDAYLVLENALNAARKLDMRYEEALAHLEIGNVYNSVGSKEEALQHFLLAAELSETSNYPDQAFRAYYHVANLHYSSDNYKEALAALDKGLHFFSIEEWMERDKFTTTDVVSAYNTMGLCYYALQNYPEAIDAYDKGLMVAGKRRSDMWVGLIHGNMGNVFFKQGKLDSAEMLIKIDLNVSNKHKAFRSIASDYLAIASIYQGRNDLLTAQTYFDSAYQVISQNKMSYASYFKRRAELAYAMGEYKKAIDFKNTYDAMADSVEKVKKSKELALIQSNNDFKTKLETLQLLEKENELKDKEIAYKNVLIYGGAFVTLLAVVLAIVLNRSNQLKVKLNKELEKEVERRTERLASTVKELDTFIYRLSHDFRRPLTTLIGLDSLGRTLSKDPETSELFSKVGKTAKQMDRMLLKMTYIHEVNTLEPTIVQTNLRDVVQEVIAGFDDDFSALKMQLIVEVPDEMIVATDTRFLQLILTNLLENAFIFTDEGKEQKIIKVSSRLTEKGWGILISDNGVGISHEIRSRIYEPFFRGSPISQGNGLGLYLVRKAMSKLKGRVVDYNGDQGESVFMLEFFIS